MSNRSETNIILFGETIYEVLDLLINKIESSSELEKAKYIRVFKNLHHVLTNMKPYGLMGKIL